MELPAERELEKTLIREILGWPECDPDGEPDGYPAVFWSSSRGCYCVVRSPDDRPAPFRPCTCLKDILELQEQVAENGLRTTLARPVFDGAVRVVADCGNREIVCESRQLSRALAAVLYRAVDDGLL